VTTVYATAGDLETRFGRDLLVELADRDGDGTPDRAVIDQALADAHGVIDGYLQRRYRLPLARVPTVLRPLATAIAFRALHTGDVPEGTERLYNDAIARLAAIAKGEMVLDPDADPADEPAGMGEALVESAERTFARSSLKGF